MLDLAIDLQHELAKHGQYGLAIPDVIISAAARPAGLIVLHDDADFGPEPNRSGSLHTSDPAPPGIDKSVPRHEPWRGSPLFVGFAEQLGAQ